MSDSVLLSTAFFGAVERATPHWKISNIKIFTPWSCPAVQRQTSFRKWKCLKPMETSHSLSSSRNLTKVVCPPSVVDVLWWVMVEKEVKHSLQLKSCHMYYMILNKTTSYNMIWGVWLHIFAWEVSKLPLKLNWTCLRRLALHDELFKAKALLRHVPTKQKDQKLLYKRKFSRFPGLPKVSHLSSKKKIDYIEFLGQRDCLDWEPMCCCFYNFLQKRFRTSEVHAGCPCNPFMIWLDPSVATVLHTSLPCQPHLFLSWCVCVCVYHL